MKILLDLTEDEIELLNNASLGLTRICSNEKTKKLKLKIAEAIIEAREKQNEGL